MGYMYTYIHIYQLYRPYTTCTEFRSGFVAELGRVWTEILLLPYPRAPSYLNSSLLGYVAIGYIELRTLNPKPNIGCIKP